MPGALGQIKVSSQPQRIQSLLVGSDNPFLLVNPDLVNQIFIGNDPGTQPIPIPPLGSLALTPAGHDIWVSSGGGAFTVQALILPGGSQWTPSPAQVAAQINALGLAKETTQLTGNTNIAQVNTTLGTPPQKSDVNQVNTTLGVPSQTADVTGLTVNGIPPLRGTINLGNATAQALTANTTATLLNAVSITRPSFEAVLSLNMPAGVGTVPFAAVLVVWTDSSTGLTVGKKLYEIAAGNGSGNAITCYLSGPCRGNQITFQIRPQDPAQAMTLTWAFNQTSHIYTIDRLLQAGYAGTAPNGFTNPAGDPSKGLLASVTSAIGPNASISRLLAASNAKIKIMLDNTVQANAAAVQINTPSAVTALYGEAGAPTSLFKTTAAIGGQGGGEWQLPNGATVLQIFNTNVTNTITPNVTITTMEY